jgi:hypothetical protein
MRLKAAYFLSAIIALAIIVGLFGLDLIQFGKDIEATSIRPAAQGNSLSADGTFVGVFENHAGTQVRVIDFWVIDEQDAQKRCRSERQVDVPNGGVFTVNLADCGIRPIGSSYDVRIKVGYTVDLDGQTHERSEKGILSGTVE